MKYRVLREEQWERIKGLLPGKASELPAAGRSSSAAMSERHCFGLAVVTTSKVSEFVSVSGVQQVLRTIVNSSYISAATLCAGVPSPRVRVRALSSAATDECTDATGSRTALAA